MQMKNSLYHFADIASLFGRVTLIMTVRPHERRHTGHFSRARVAEFVA